jgi:hypothetical protein
MVEPSAGPDVHPSAQAKYYRQKAAEVRRLASRLWEPEAKKDMEAIAMRYEKLADALDQAENTRTPESSG